MTDLGRRGYFLKGGLGARSLAPSLLISFSLNPRLFRFFDSALPISSAKWCWSLRTLRAGASPCIAKRESRNRFLRLTSPLSLLFVTQWIDDRALQPYSEYDMLVTFAHAL